MKRLFTLALTLFTFYLQAQITRKVLFLGNSYTSVNNLPQLTAAAAASAGDNLVFDSNMPGGHKLIQHSADPLSTNKVMAGGWDYVVLQEQSETPALQNGNFHTGAADLCRLIKQYNPCAQPLLYMTWGRKNGDPLNCPLYPLMCTYNGMDSLTRINYIQVAQLQNAEVSPVGAVWKYLRQNYPAINLYQPDESHPSNAGSYAAACCFYTAIFKKDPLLISYNYVLSPADAAIIRNAVKTVVFNVLPSWNFKVNVTTADFNYTIGSGANEAVFNYLPPYQGLGAYSNTFNWNFGDGTSATYINYFSPINHSYVSNGTYTVTLTVSNCDLSGMQQATVQHTISFCAHTPTVSHVYSWHCPAPDTLLTQAYSTYQWYSNGELIPGQTNRRVPENYPWYNLSVMATQNGCAEMSQPHVHVSDPVFTNYDVTVTGITANTATLCTGGTLTLNLTSLNGTETIQWLKNGLPISSGNDTLLITSSGSYSVSLFYANCPNYSLYSNLLTYAFVPCAYTGLPDTHNSRAGISIFPNPGSGIITISTTEKLHTVEIYNSLGQAVLIESNINSNSHTFTLSEYSKGVYVAKIFSGNVWYTEKIVIE